MIRYVYLFLLAAVCLSGQTPGTVSQTTTSTVTATAGAVSCSFTHATPDPKPITIHIDCKSAAGSTMAQDVTGMFSTAASFGAGADLIAWDIKQDAGGNLAWTVTPNGAAKSGTF